MTPPTAEASTTATLDDFADLAWSVPRRADVLTDDHVLSGSLGGFSAVTDLAGCLLPLLKALGWEGDPRHLAEALPHFADQLDLTDFLNVMSNLGFASRSLRLKLADLDSRLAPGLWLPDNGPAQVVVRRDHQGLHLFDPTLRCYSTVPHPLGKGRFYLFDEATDGEKRGHEGQQGNYVSSLIGRFRPLILRILGTSLIANVLVLATPLFIMGVYDRVVSTGSMTVLAFMLVGVAVALLGDLALKSLRTRMIAYIGARLDYLLGRGVLERLLFLAPAYTELANISSQVTRLKDFETIREFFAGPVATVIFEIPFTLLFLIVMAWLSGALVFVPIGGAVLFALLAVIAQPRVRKLVAEAGRAGNRRQEFLVESLSKIRDIRNSGSEAVWEERYRELSADAAIRSAAAARASAYASAIAQALIMITGMITLSLGVLLALEGKMSVGGLIAAMIIVWWVLRPLQVGFAALGQIERVRDSIRQIDRLMQVAPERKSDGRATAVPQVRGRISFNTVSMRYVADADPAIVGLNLEIQPGEMVGFVGPNGSGKSTILKMMLGMYRPQAGNIRIDGVDIRQVDPIELRRVLAYVPQQCEVFFGTIAQNLRLAHPTASDRDLRWACREAALLEDIDALERGFETRVGDGRSARLPSNFFQRLSLARAYLKRAPITLFDEPANGLDFIADQQFMKALERMRSHSTVLLVTHRPSHLRLMDRIVVLTAGQVRMAGPAKQVLERLPQGLF